MMRKIVLTAITALCALSPADSALAREELRIVGSPTIATYAEVVGQEQSKRGFAEPGISTSNTGPGLKHFCKGTGSMFPDIAMAARKMKPEEAEDCKANGVAEVSEFKIGYDGVLFVYRAKDEAFKNFAPTGRQMWLAMAKSVPVNGAIVANPYMNWNEIDPALPAKPILIYAPDKTAAMRDVFGSVVVKPFCAGEPAIAALPDEQRAEVCSALRNDGHILEFAQAQDIPFAMQETGDQPVGFSNVQIVATSPVGKDLQVAMLDGVAPNAVTISSGEYALSRAHYLYVKNAHVGEVPGIMEFVSAFLSDDAQGPSGYLLSKGWIPLKDDERQEMAARAKSLVN
jgi:phosphate transport system substrate-binding protein